MEKLTDEMLKQVNGGNVTIMGTSYSASDIINLWNTQKAFCKTIFNGYASSNPDIINAIKTELSNSGLTIPDDLKRLLGM